MRATNSLLFPLAQASILRTLLPYPRVRWGYETVRIQLKQFATKRADPLDPALAEPRRMICTNGHAGYSPISFTCRRLKAWPPESTKDSLAPEDLRGDRSSPRSVFELFLCVGNFY
jgi:hypothetical protein